MTLEQPVSNAKPGSPSSQKDDYLKSPRLAI